MEVAMGNGISGTKFVELNDQEMMGVDGGSIFGTVLAVIAIGKITVEVTVGGVVAAVGAAYGAGQVINEIYNAFK